MFPCDVSKFFSGGKKKYHPQKTALLESVGNIKFKPQVNHK